MGIEVRSLQATMMAMASRRRTAMVVLSTRTAIGSRPTSAFVQDLDPGALDEAELDQPALELDVRERGARIPAERCWMTPV